MISSPDGFSVSVGAAARALRPQERLPIAEWAEKYRRLPRGRSVQRWDNDRMPFLRGIMAALDDDHPAPIVCYIKPSQTGGSMVAANWIGRTIHQNPASMLALFPGEKEAGKWVRGVLNPMLRSTRELKAILPPGRKRSRTEDDSTIKEKHFPGGVLYTGSGNIANDLAQITVRYGLMDDADRIPANIPGEGDPAELLIGRTTIDPLRKVLIVSSPTDEDNSRVNRYWEASTQDRWYMPCPRCSAMQVLTFDNLEWPDGKPTLAVYRCEHCEATIEHHQKTGMLSAGEWRPTHPERENEVKGFHTNGLMTPIGLGFTWAEHAAAWDRARGKPEKVRVFYNTRRGEVVKSEKVRLAWEAIAARREPYSVLTIPPGYVLLTAGVDIQANRIEAGIVGWARGERAAVIDHTVFWGDPTRPEVWQMLDAYASKSIVNSFGIEMRISAMAVDSGNWQHEVLNFTRERRARNIFATKGSSVRSRQPIGRPTLVDHNRRGHIEKRGAEQYQLGVTVIKRTLYARLAADAEALPSERLVRFPADLPDEFFRQLAAERYDERDGWVKVYDHNEVLDIITMAFGAAMHQSVQIHRMREADWARLEQLYERAPGAAPSAQPVRLGLEDGLPLTAAALAGH